MRITRQWNLSKHAAVVGTSGGAKMMLGLEVMESSIWFYPTQNLDVLGHICLGLCPDCDYTLLFWRLQIWYLCFQGTHRYILDPYYRHTHVSSSLFQAIHAQQKNMAELLGTATKTYIPCCQRGGPVSQLPRFTVCDGSGMFKGPFLCHRWWIPGVGGWWFPQFWWIFLRSLGWFSLGLEYRLEIRSRGSLAVRFFQTPGEGNPERCQWKLGSDALERCTSHVAWHPGHSPTWKICFLKHLVQKWSGFRDCTGHCLTPVSMIDLVWICRGTGGDGLIRNRRLSICFNVCLDNFYWGFSLPLSLYIYIHISYIYICISSSPFTFLLAVFNTPVF